MENTFNIAKRISELTGEDDVWVLRWLHGTGNSARKNRRRLLGNCPSEDAKKLFEKERRRISELHAQRNSRKPQPAPEPGRILKIHRARLYEKEQQAKFERLFVHNFYESEKAGLLCFDVEKGIARIKDTEFSVPCRFRRDGKPYQSERPVYNLNLKYNFCYVAPPTHLRLTTAVNELCEKSCIYEMTGSGKYKKITGLHVPVKMHDKVVAFIEAEQQRADQREEDKRAALDRRREKTQGLLEDFCKFLDENSISYSLDKARTTRTQYVLTLDGKYRFSDHPRGKNHYRFNQMTGERDYVDYSDSTLVRNKSELRLAQQFELDRAKEAANETSAER